MPRRVSADVRSSEIGRPFENEIIARHGRRALRSSRLRLWFWHWRRRWSWWRRYIVAGNCPCGDVIASANEFSDVSDVVNKYGRRTILRGSVTELRLVISAPAVHVAVSRCGHGEVAAGSDYGDRGKVDLDGAVPLRRGSVAELPEGVSSPGPDVASCIEGNGMETKGLHIDDGG